MEYKKITKKGQVTIPLRFRQLLEVKAGEKVLFDVEGKKVVLKKAPRDPIAELIGLGKGIFGTCLEYQRKMRSEWERR